MCAQQAYDGFSMCGYHLRRRLDKNMPEDRFYHEKVAKGLIEPTDHWLTPAEARALLGGRKHGDGRRLDQWAT